MRDSPSLESEATSLPEAGRRLRPLRNLLRFLRPYRKQIAGAIVALIIAATTVLGLGMGLRYLVDGAFGSGNPDLLDQAVIVLLGVVFVLAGASYARFYLVSWIGERVVADIRKAVFDHVLTLSPGFFETTRTGEILSRLTTDTTLIQVVVGSSASVALRNFLLFIGGSVMLLVTSPTLTGLVFLVVPLVVAPILIYGRRVRRLSRDSQDRLADVGVYIEESLNAIRTVQAFTHEPVDRTRFGDRVEDAFATSVRRISARAMLTATVIVLVFSAVSAILWLGGRNVLDGTMSAGDLSAFVFYAVVVAGAVGAISEVVGDLQRASGATERLMDLLAIASPVVAPTLPVALPEPAEGRVEFDRVRFRYPARPDRPALEDFSLSVKPGEKIALVGPSGAGKTTVFQLLLRFYDPESGAVRVDGIDVRQAAPATLRGRIGLVPQEPVIFSANAWENIRYGRPDATDAEVRAAAEAAAADDFLDRLPEGFATFLGEKGVRLSGGQRQRLAIARAILRNPAVLLLDEATSALDAESERAVQTALDRLMVGRTTLVIAHRLATVLKADRIIVLDQGRVVATGTHAELSRQGGLYARLAALQFDQAADALAGIGDGAISRG
ncbi:MAG: ATP-binding cassette domain-containing protein [Alphaproteobacteria bacterium]|nr:ATP-binding cassette domain-containing protein [Alphaproteobacteria bacterium]MBU0798050.1 ATP-binding cassette domain-containing protein [Alphaproteobacteria bacterium]MBU0888750.1 ATP-binding cassette domain-containing protein [Alphaproteobacteria bacterium]MBU1812531.1 ATP-binding cassette domain-containing protein [Alphaproteobacteria bacterium]